MINLDLASVRDDESSLMIGVVISCDGTVQYLNQLCLLLAMQGERHQGVLLGRIRRKTLEKTAMT